jgi:methyl-accepting chemotaxis protein
MDEDLQTPILKNILETYEWTYFVFSVGADGYKVARSDDKDMLKPDASKAFFRGDRVYCQQVMTGKKFGQQVLLSRTLGKPAFVLCSAIRRVTIAGALCIGMTLEGMSTLVTQLELELVRRATLYYLILTIRLLLMASRVYCKKI